MYFLTRGSNAAHWADFIDADKIADISRVLRLGKTPDGGEVALVLRAVMTSSIRTC
jgi:hypothetical protein